MITAYRYIHHTSIRSHPTRSLILEEFYHKHLSLIPLMNLYYDKPYNHQIILSQHMTYPIILLLIDLSSFLMVSHEDLLLNQALNLYLYKAYPPLVLLYLLYLFDQHDLPSYLLLLVFFLLLFSLSLYDTLLFHYL